MKKMSLIVFVGVVFWSLDLVAQDTKAVIDAASTAGPAYSRWHRPVRNCRESCRPAGVDRMSYFFMNFLTSMRKSAPYTLPSKSTVTPSAMLDPEGYG